MFFSIFFSMDRQNKGQIPKLKYPSLVNVPETAGLGPAQAEMGTAGPSILFLEVFFCDTAYFPTHDQIIVDLVPFLADFCERFYWRKY